MRNDVASGEALKIDAAELDVLARGAWPKSEPSSTP